MARRLFLAPSLIWLLTTAAQPAVAEADWIIRPIQFASADGIALAGSVVTSREHPPVAAVVLVHGSGPAPRYTALAQLTALNGTRDLELRR